TWCPRTALPRLPGCSTQGQFVLHQPANVVLAEIERLEAVDRGSNNGLGLFHQVDARRDRLTNEHAGAVAQLENPFALQVAIGANHGVGVDQQVFGHFANAGELLPGPDRPRLNGVLQVFDELKIQRRTRQRVEAQRGQLCALSIQYTEDAFLASAVGVGYSWRSVRAGSRRAARVAGIEAANTQAAMMTNRLTAYAMGSRTATSPPTLAAAGVASNSAASPAAEPPPTKRPTPTGRTDCDRTRRVTSRVVAPSGIRP